MSTSTPTQRQEAPRYAPRGALALAPEAYGGIYDGYGSNESIAQDSVAIVRIRGPLMHHEDWWYDSYDAIRERVCAALDARPRALILAIDSPGGLVSGCFETARAVRDYARSLEIPLYAYVDGQATSAAYAWACVASSVWCPDTGTVGSIGVITALLDQTVAWESFGYKWTIVTSGARKDDGDPRSATTEDAVDATRKRINDLAEVFFAHVATERSISVDAVRAQQAGLFIGSSALDTKLIDQVGTLEELVAAIAEGSAIAGPTKAASATTVAAQTDSEKRPMKTLLRALGLGDNASEAEAVAALQARDATTQRFLALSGKASPAEAEGTFLAWKIGAEKASKAEADLAALQKTTVDAEAHGLIDAAVKEGRLPPADKATVVGQYEAHGLGALKATLSLLKPLVTADQKPSSDALRNAKANEGGKRTSLTAAEKAHCAKHGVSEESYLAAINEEV